MKFSFFIVSIRHEWGHTNYGLRERLNGIQEVSGSIPLISTIDVGYDALGKVLNPKGFGTFFLLFAPI